MLHKRAIRPFLLCILLFFVGCAGQTEELSKRHSTVTPNPHNWEPPPKSNSPDIIINAYLDEIRTLDYSHSIDNNQLKKLKEMDQESKNQLIDMLQNFSKAYPKTTLINKGQGPLSEDIDRYTVVSITARPAPSAPTAPFFTKLSEGGQKAVLNAVKDKDNNMSKEKLEALLALLKTIETGEVSPIPPAPQKSAQTSGEKKFEITISNHLNTGKPYDRIEQITIYLFLDDKGAKFTDINMLESIFREVDVGTALRTYQLSSTFGGEIGIPLGPTGGAAGVNLSVSPSYSEQFQRTFKEQLVLRSVQIGGKGKWLSISQNSSQEHKIGGSIRHTVTICVPSESKELGCYYIALASVRCVEKGGETIPEGDDEVQQKVALEVGYVPF